SRTMAWRPWTKQELRVLGTIPDREFARRFRRTLQAIATKRMLRGIPRFIGAGDFRLWTATEDSLLGTAPDRAIARLLGRSLFAVQNKRLKMRIPMANPGHRIWTKAE